jgi:hypothetical protein
MGRVGAAGDNAAMESFFSLDPLMGYVERCQDQLILMVGTAGMTGPLVCPAFPVLFG